MVKKETNPKFLIYTWFVKIWFFLNLFKLGSDRVSSRRTISISYLNLIFLIWVLPESQQVKKIFYIFIWIWVGIYQDEVKLSYAITTSKYPALLTTHKHGLRPQTSPSPFTLVIKPGSARRVDLVAELVRVR